MEEKTYKQKQRILLVNRDFQLRYAGVAVLVGLLSTLLTALLILFPLYAFEILRIPRFLPWPVLILMGFAALLNMFLVAFMGVLMTHRIAGPMYSLVRQFRRVEEGYWCGQLKLRDEDELRYVVRNFNAMMESVHRQASQDVEQLEALEKIINDSNEFGQSSIDRDKILEGLRALIGKQKSRLQ